MPILVDRLVGCGDWTVGKSADEGRKPVASFVDSLRSFASSAAEPGSPVNGADDDRNELTDAESWAIETVATGRWHVYELYDEFISSEPYSEGVEPLVASSGKTDSMRFNDLERLRSDQ